VQFVGSRVAPQRGAIGAANQHAAQLHPSRHGSSGKSAATSGPAMTWRPCSRAPQAFSARGTAFKLNVNDVDPGRDLE